MSEIEKAKRIDALLPSLESIREEYRAQGRALTAAEAEAIREQIREGLASGHLDAMGNLLGDDALEKVSGGGLAPTPTVAPDMEPETAPSDTLAEVVYRAR